VLAAAQLQVRVLPLADVVVVGVNTPPTLYPVILILLNGSRVAGIGAVPLKVMNHLLVPAL
jgi:hypothetical protein